MKSLRAVFLPLLAFCAFAPQADANLTLQLFEVGGNVRLEYSGALDLSGMTFGLISTVDEHRVRLVTPSIGQPFSVIINVVNSGPSEIRAYSNPFSSAPDNYVTGITPSATSFGGTPIILPTISNASTATLRFDKDDFAGDVWSGSGFMQWDNTTIAALGIDPSPKTWVINNAAANTITMTQVPEPGTALLAAAGLGLLLPRRRRVPATGDAR